MTEVELPVLEPALFSEILDDVEWARFEGSLEAGRRSLTGRTLWHVSSTATGGGGRRAAAVGAGLPEGRRGRISLHGPRGTEEFFLLTKRIHHMLHSEPGDGEGLGDTDLQRYAEVLDGQAGLLAGQVRSGDVVVLHDPRVVGFAPLLRSLGAGVIWNCHIGTDTPNEHVRLAWRFLTPYVTSCHAAVFSRRRHVWDGLDACLKVALIPPCIDAFSQKNQDMASNEVEAILSTTGLLAGGEDRKAPGAATYRRSDGSPASVRSRGTLVEDSPIPPGAPVVSQVSRWDPLKDHAGLASAFAAGVSASTGAHLVLAGPSPDGVSDDPEGEATLAGICECRASPPPRARRRIHIACIPMGDLEENAAIVNALPRRSRFVVQKSVAEGFGLTVAEALWKERPMVASGVGGIREQVTDGENGLLVDEPRDLARFAGAITQLLSDPDLARRFGAKGRETVRQRFPAPSYLSRYLRLAGELVAQV